MTLARDLTLEQKKELIEKEKQIGIIMPVMSIMVNDKYEKPTA